MKIRTVLALVLCAPALAAAQTSSEFPTIRVDIPALDVPYNTAHGYRAPSMAQALSLSETFYEGSHRAIQRAWGEHVWYSRLSITAADIVDTMVLPLPASDGWLHEEYHRTILGQRGAGSFNDVYHFVVNADAIAVSHVADADLVALKRDHPAEQARLSAAGIEGEYELVQRLQQREFFDGVRGFHQPLYWLEKIGSAVYVMSGTDDATNAETDDMNRREGSSVAVRDFTGHDFTAWVYDLFRPNEPYQARGSHPSGVGLDRYIKPSDLTAEEHAYLHRQGQLQLLNFVDPFLIGVRGVSVDVRGAPLRLTANLGHLLTPFGRTIDTKLFLSRGRANVLVTVHAYANGDRSFPGVEATLADYPVALAGHHLAVSPRVAIWQQPAAQMFRTTTGNAGGLAALKLRFAGRRTVNAFAEIEAKTAGWVAGTESLDRNVSVRVGVSLALR